MAKVNSKIIFFFLSLMVVAFYSSRFLYLRNLALEKIPRPEILDEFDFVWVGKSFLQAGVPVGWSDFGAYRDENNRPLRGKISGFVMEESGKKITYRDVFKQHFPVVSVETVDYGLGDRYINFVAPYFDHPLLAAVIYGLGAKGDSIRDVFPSDFRKTSIFLASLTGILIFVLAYQMFGLWPALISFFVYGTVPSFVFVSRLALAENVMIPLFLISLFFANLYQFQSRKIFLFLSGLFAGLTALAKMPGWFIVLAIAFYLWNQKKRRELYWFLVPALTVGLLYPVYGLIVAPKLYLQIVLSQAGRGFSAALNLLEQIVRPTFNNWFTDGWWTGSWLISFIYLFKFRKERKKKLLSISFTFLILTTLLMSSANYPWYFISAIPFLSIFVGVFFWDIFFFPEIERVLPFFIFFFSPSFYWGFNVLNQNSPKLGLVYKGFLLILLAVSLLDERLRKFGWWRWGWYLLFVLVLHRLFLWNFRSITYLVSNWGS